MARATFGLHCRVSVDQATLKRAVYPCANRALPLRDNCDEEGPRLLGVRAKAE